MRRELVESGVTTLGEGGRGSWKQPLHSVLGPAATNAFATGLDIFIFPPGPNATHWMLRVGMQYSRMEGVGARVCQCRCWLADKRKCCPFCAGHLGAVVVAIAAWAFVLFAG